jgi:hypothetical protein
MMAWSRRRTWFVLILAILVLAAFAPTWLQPVSPLHKAFVQIRIGMTAEQVRDTLMRCGCRNYQNCTGIGTENYTGASGEELTIRWERPLDWDHLQVLFPPGHVVEKEYHSGIAMRLCALWDRLTRMFDW